MIRKEGIAVAIGPIALRLSPFATVEGGLDASAQRSRR